MANPYPRCECQVWGIDEKNFHGMPYSCSVLKVMCPLLCTFYCSIKFGEKLMHSFHFVKYRLKLLGLTGQ